MKGVYMLEKIKNAADAAIDVGIKLISLSIVLQIIFGNKVAFLTGDVIASILNIVWTLGNAGLAGLIAAGIIWKLLDKDITNELSKQGIYMEQLTDLAKKVLENKSLTIFLGIVVLALFFGWIGGGA